MNFAKNGTGKLFKSTLNNRFHNNLACVIDKSSRGAKLQRAFEELPQPSLEQQFAELNFSALVRLVQGRI